MKTNLLPTTEELLKFYWHLKLESNSKKPTGLLFKIVDAVISVLETSCVPIVSKPRVTELLQKKLKNYADLKKSVSRKETENFKIKLAAFQESICSLFDISACDCKDFTACSCPKEKKVPIQEQIFLVDQRSKNKMYIGTIDKKVTKQMEKSFQRVERSAVHATVHNWMIPHNSDHFQPHLQMKIRMKIASGVFNRN